MTEPSAALAARDALVLFRAQMFPFDFDQSRLARSDTAGLLRLNCDGSVFLRRGWLKDHEISADSHLRKRKQYEVWIAFVDDDMGGRGEFARSNTGILIHLRKRFHAAFRNYRDDSQQTKPGALPDNVVLQDRVICFFQFDRGRRQRWGLRDGMRQKRS